MALTPAQHQAESAIAAAKAVMNSLQLAIKMSTLYAEDHVYCQKSIVRLHGDIETFVTKFGTLVLEIRNDRLLYEGETVYEGASKDGDLSFAMFRDGMLELIFLTGIGPEETGFFAKTLDRYKSLATTAEGDIVTALWEARLPHIHYVATDNILEIEQRKQLPIPEPREFQMPQLPAEATGVQTPEDDQLSVTSSLAEAVKPRQFEPINPTTLQLTAQEADDLEEMVRAEEERDATQEIMDMMGDILKDQQDEEFFAYIIEYMLDEFAASFRRRDFEVAFRIMRTLHQVRKLSEESKPWAISRVQGFFAQISRPEFLEHLNGILPTLNVAQLKTAGKVLALLAPEATLGLGPLLVEVSGPPFEVLSHVLVSLASQNIRPIEQLLNTAEEPLVFRLVPLLGRLEAKKSGRLLFRLARYPSERVRLEALRAIIQLKLWIPEKMGFLLEDESDLIRRLTIKFLGTRKSDGAEALLAKYIRNGKFDGHPSEELIACFKAIGACGTERSLPFLKETLLKGGWLSKFRASSMRQGAAIALAQFRTEQSLRVLEEAAKSPFPAVRSAAQSAFQNKGGEP